MKKIILILVGWVLISGLIFAENKKEVKQKPEPRIEKLGKVLFLEIIEENQDNIPKELLPPRDLREKAGLLFRIGEIKYNEKEKKVVYTEPPHFLPLRKIHKYEYKALVKCVLKGVGPKRDETYANNIACFELPKKIGGSIEVISYTKDGTVKIKYKEDTLKQNISLKSGESWSSNLIKRNANPFEFLKVKDAETLAKQKGMDESSLRKLIPKEGFHLSTQTKIINYGIANMDAEIYE